MVKPLDLSGHKFGKLTAIRWTGKSLHKYGRVWLCKCECGNFREVPVMFLRHGSIHQCTSCGNNSTEERERKFAEKMKNALRENRRDKLRNVWRNMKQRCYDPKHKYYKYYGGRGIFVCKEWLDDFEQFKEWAILNGYSDNLTIERIDNDKGYSPDNCRFATRHEQAFNRRNTLFVIFKGKHIPVAELVYDLGLNLKTFSHYLITYQEKG